jgi:3-hydroxyacyl-[acyl-carrier-protein] dehydratase
VDWYAFVDDVVLHEPERVVTRHRLDETDPFFRDHFPGRPVLPGVLATEALVQAGRVLLEGHVEGGLRWVLGSAKAVRFSRFLTPGQWLVCDVRLLSATPEEAKLAVAGLVGEGGEIDVAALDGLPTAVSGRLVLRPARFGPAWNPRGS